MEVFIMSKNYNDVLDGTKVVYMAIVKTVML